MTDDNIETAIGNPAALAEKLAAQAAANIKTAETAIQTDVAKVEAVVTGEIAVVKTAETTVQTATTQTTADTIASVGKAHAAACHALAHIESIPGEITSELVEAKTKLLDAINWIEAHFTKSKAAA